MQMKIVGTIVCMLLLITSIPVIGAIDDHPSTTPVTTNLTNGVYWVGVEYTFCIVIPSDPQGDQIYIFVDWGDGTNTGWLGPYNPGEIVDVTHFWTKVGIYVIKMKAKNEYGEGSESYLRITVIPPNRFFRSMEISGTLKTRPWKGLIFSILNFDCATVDKAISRNVQLDPFTCHNYKFVALVLNVHSYSKETLYIEASTPFAILIGY